MVSLRRARFAAGEYRMGTAAAAAAAAVYAAPAAGSSKGVVCK